MLNSQTLLDLIMQNIQNRGLTSKECLLACGINTSFLTDWKNNKIKSPSYDKIVKLFEFLQLDLNLISGKEKSSPTDKLSADERDLLTYYNGLPLKEQGKLLGRAEALAEQFRAVELEEPKIVYLGYFSLPVSAGTGVYLDGEEKEILELPETPLTAEANFALEVRGDSMEPKFYDGDTILIRTQPNVEEGEIGVFILNDEGFVKKFGGDRLISLNEKYDDILLHEYDNLQCQGKVIGKI